MIFSKSLCIHSKFEKSFLSIYSCKNCSVTQVMSLLKKKNNDIFNKPKEYCFNYEINIIQLIRNKILHDEKTFINYKSLLENLKQKKNFISNKDKNYDDINDSIDEIIDKEEENYEDSSYKSKIDESNSENNFLESLNIYYNNRIEIIFYIKRICNKFNASKNCFFLTMALIEEFFKLSDNKNINDYQIDLIINAIFILAFKFVDTDSEYYLCYKSFKTFFYKEKKHIKQSDLRMAEIQCLEILEYNLNIFTIFDFLEMVLSSGIVLEKESFNFNIISKIYNDCFNLLDFCFGENDIMLEHSLSEIVFSIIHLVRKQNNLIYKIEKYFSKIYNIELKEYLNCIKHISSIYYKNENLSNNLLSLKDKRKKKIIMIKEKNYKYDDDIENIDNNQLLKEKFNKNENEKASVSCLYDSGEINKINKKIFNNNSSIMSNPFNFSKSKSLDNKIIDLLKEKNRENLNKKNSILIENSINPNNKDKDKVILKPIKQSIFNSSRNLDNSRYNNISNNNSSISTYNNSKNNNELKNKFYKNSSYFSSIDINKSASKYLYYLRDSINSNNSKNNSILYLNKNKSCNNIFELNPKINNKKLINSFKKSFEIKDKTNNNELSVKNKLNYYINSNIKNNETNNEENKNIKGKNNIFQIIKKIYNNINKDNIKLPLIKK